MASGGMALGSSARIAWRNVWRNPRRTGLALAAIGLSVMLVLVYDGVLRAYGDWIVEAVTGPMLGHVQVHAPVWREDRATDRTIPRAAATLDAIRRSPGVASVSPRLYAPVLAALADEGVAAVVVGIDPATETGRSRLFERLDVPLGPGAVVVGRALAEQMGVREGDRIAIVGQAVDGSLANDLFTVASVVSTSIDLVSRQGLVMALPEAQALFSMPDEVHELLVHVSDAAAVAEVSTRLAALPELAGQDVRTWQEAAPDMVALVRIVEVAWLFVLVLVLVAAAAGVANTMLMATFERTHELGMLLALGTTPARIVGLIVTEAVALGLTGAALGATLGIALVVWAGHTGVDYAALTGGGPREISFGGLVWSLVLYPRLAVVDVVRVLVAVVLTALVACVWPAVRAARLEPATALRA